MAVDQEKTLRFNSQAYPGTCLLLYVDDDNVNQQVLDMLLSSRVEYRVLLACDQQEVEEILEHEQYLPDVVFMDNQLVDCTGVEVIAWMRERYSEDLVFVMCTARSQSTAKKLAATAKAQGYLCKPYTMKELLAVLSELKIPHLPNVPLNAKMTKSDASETQRDVCPSTQTFNPGFATPKVPLGTLVRTAASALQGCQAALTTLGSRSTCGSSGSDAGRSVRTADHFQSDGMSTTIQTTAMDRDRASVRRGGASAASPHSSFDVNDTPCGATMSDAFRLKEYANVGYRADRTFPSQFNKGRVVDSGMRHAGHSHHINEAVTSIGQVLKQEQWPSSSSAGWLMPSFSSDATLPQPSFASPNPAAESTASFTPWRSVTSLKTSRDPSVPASSVSSTQGALQLKEGSTEPDPLYARCGGHMAVHRGSWPQTASSKQTMSVQMPRRTVGPASDATGSATWRDARQLLTSDFDAGPQFSDSAVHPGHVSTASSWQSNIENTALARESPEQASRCKNALGDFGMGDHTGHTMHAYQPATAPTPARAVTAASSGPSMLAAPGTNHVALALSPRKLVASNVDKNETSSGSRTLYPATTLMAIVQSGSVAADAKDEYITETAETGASCGPVWVRLDPPKHGQGRLGHAVIIGTGCPQKSGMQPIYKQLPAGCALTADVLQAELLSLQIASGAKEAEDIAQAVNRVITLMNLPAACTTPQSSTVDSDDSLLLEDLLNVLGISSACEALRDKGLTLSRLKCMSAMQVMQQGVVSFHDLEALMDALHSL